MRYGYVRVSTTEQNPERQIEALVKDGVESENIFVDKITGVSESRPALDALLGVAKSGDSITVLSFDRLARSTTQLLGFSERFAKDGIDLVSLKERLDTSTPQGKLFFTISAAFAEFERSIIKERQAQGIEIAKREGKYKGGVKRHHFTDEQLEAASGMDWKEACSYLGVSKSKYYTMRDEGLIKKGVA